MRPWKQNDQHVSLVFILLSSTLSFLQLSIMRFLYVGLSYFPMLRNTMLKLSNKKLLKRSREFWWLIGIYLTTLSQCMSSWPRLLVKDMKAMSEREYMIDSMVVPFLMMLLLVLFGLRIRCICVQMKLLVSRSALWSSSKIRPVHFIIEYLVQNNFLGQRSMKYWQIKSIR